MSGNLGTLSNLLEQLQANHGLQVAAVVGMDGLLVESSSDGQIEAEAIAAVAAPGLLMMNDLAMELGEDAAELTTMEYANHVVIMLPLTADALLLAVAETSAMNLGQMRIVLRRSIEAFQAAVEDL